MLQEAVYRIAKRRIRSRQQRAGDGHVKQSSAEDYKEWRKHSLEQHYLDHFDVAQIRDKDVVDFGSGTGNLAFTLAGLGARSCIGLEVNESSVDAANRQVQDEPVEFRLSGESTIALDTSSADVIVCFDVLEHIVDYKAIMREWRRILRPGGNVLIWWQPYYHPYGHHAYTYIPIPWVHVLVNDKKQAAICARIVDLPEFDPPHWDFDENGKLINRFRQSIEDGTAGDEGFLNHLTLSLFEKECRAVGFEIEKRTLGAFSWSFPVGTMSRLFTNIPGLREFFTSYATYVLKSP